MPSKEAMVRRLNFCGVDWRSNRRGSAQTSGKTRKPNSIGANFGAPKYGGLDLGSTTDLTGLVLMIEPLLDGEPWLCVRLPAAGRGSAAQGGPRQGAVRRVEDAGYLDTTPGKAVSKRMVAQRLSALAEFFEIVCVAYDRWRIEDFLSMAADDGIALPEMKPFDPGATGHEPAVEHFETMLLNGQLAHAITRS